MFGNLVDYQDFFVEQFCWNFKVVFVFYFVGGEKFFICDGFICDNVVVVFVFVFVFFFVIFFVFGVGSGFC